MARFWALLFQLAFSVVAFGTEFRDPNVAHSKADVFDDCHIVDAASNVSQRAAALSGKQRFRFLLNWVLPQDGQATLRLSHEFSPSYPAGMSKYGGIQERRLATGGDIICPALELIDAATSPDDFELLQETLARFQPRNRFDSKNKLTLQYLLSSSQHLSKISAAHFNEVLSLARATDPFVDEHRAAGMLLREPR